MTISSRAKHLSAGLAFLLSSTMLSGIAHAQDAAKPDAADATEIVIVGKGQTRSVTTLVPGNLDLLPPGTSIQRR
jgi:iron complex outermembrane receptor protein